MHNNVTTRIRFFIGRILRRMRFKRAISKVKQYDEIASRLDEFIDYCVHYLQEKTGIYFVGIYTIDPAEEHFIFRNGVGDAQWVRTLLARKHELPLRKNISIWDFKSGLQHETNELPVSLTSRQSLNR